MYRRRGPVIRQLAFGDDEEEEERLIVWREQFDSIRRDFESAFEGMDSVHRIEWMNAFGKYWIRGGEWCRDDIKMMRWLMTGANHATVDTCGEHVGSSAVSNLKYVGNRLVADVLDNPSKLLKQELGMQLPLKSVFKLRRDARKFTRRNGVPVVSGVLDPFYWYYDGYLKCGQSCSGREVLLANNKSSFFDECIIQHFYSMTVSPTTLRFTSMAFRDIYDMTDDLVNPTTYQHSQMNMSRELTTFAVGGPRFSRNGVLTADTTNNGLVIGSGVIRDCRHIALAPLFRYHYELPTNPDAKYIDQHMAWLVQMRNQVLRREDLFQDADEYGYVATQLTHLPKLVSFDAGNMLTFGEDDNLLSSEEAVNCTFLKDLNREFRQRTDTSAMVQREPLNDSSVYVVNRRSLLTNKPQVFYNDDSSFVYSAPLATNVLKWMESILGDCSGIYSSGELFEPIKTIALDFDKVKLCVFGKGKGRDVMFSHCPPVNYAQDIPMTRTKDWIFEHDGSHVKGLKKCVYGTCLYRICLIERTFT